MKISRPNRIIVYYRKHKKDYIFCFYATVICLILAFLVMLKVLEMYP